MKYRLKSVVEAWQITAVLDYKSWPKWLIASWKKAEAEVGAVYPEVIDRERVTNQTYSTATGRLCVRTPAGPVCCDIGDWIVYCLPLVSLCFDGELFVMTDGSFREAYEEAPRCTHPLRVLNMSPTPAACDTCGGMSVIICDTCGNGRCRDCEWRAIHQEAGVPR